MVAMSWFSDEVMDPPVTKTVEPSGLTVLSTPKSVPAERPLYRWTQSCRPGAAAAPPAEAATVADTSTAVVATASTHLVRNERTGDRCMGAPLSEGQSRAV